MIKIDSILAWLKKNYGVVVTIVGGYALYKVVIFFDENERYKEIEIIKSFSKYQKYPLLFNEILMGESKTYDDMNYYQGDTLRSYIKNKVGNRYGGMNKDLSSYTIGEIIAFQKNSRSSANGQLWAVGRYQVIPETLKGIYSTAGLTLNDKFTPENQDKIGMALLRPMTKKYLSGQISNTKANKEASALEIAQTWSSVGVPYAMNGKFQKIAKDESYYKKSGGIDSATTKTENIQKLLEQSRLK